MLRNLKAGDRLLEHPPVGRIINRQVQGASRNANSGGGSIQPFSIDGREYLPEPLAYVTEDGVRWYRDIVRNTSQVDIP